MQGNLCCPEAHAPATNQEGGQSSYTLKRTEDKTKPFLSPHDRLAPPAGSGLSVSQRQDWTSQPRARKEPPSRPGLKKSLVRQRGRPARITAEPHTPVRSHWPQLSPPRGQRPAMQRVAAGWPFSIPAPLPLPQLPPSAPEHERGRRAHERLSLTTANIPVSQPPRCSGPRRGPSPCTGATT